MTFGCTSGLRSFARGVAASAALALMAFAGADGAMAQTYPSKPVRLVLPYSPGGIIDYVGRTLAQNLAGPLGQQVIAENRPGAGGITGTDTVARSAPDGYTIVLMDPAIVINPTLQPSMPYDLFKQLTTVSVVSSSPLVLVVAPELPIRTVDDLIKYGKANPGKLNFASAGIGTTPNLAGEMLKLRSGIDATHIPYKSIGQSYPDLMSNKVQFAFSSIAGALPFTTDNRVRAIATTSEKRSPVYPDQPTMIEAGLKGFEVDLWLGVFAPAATPPDVVAKLSAAIGTALKDPELAKAFAKVGAQPRGTSAKDGDAFVRAEFAKWKSVIEDAKIKLD
ncbi:MAG: tripartite tricarboxylate transporter substrate binding protein [Beijerinckiaceae bacterium]